ncbi:hypothetical protein LX36DRAFT_236801 [Colletotrichum falcatum]|nr:hypothetical protein LX36DRAFT_236801 [Colletotrichum falcatum]
MPHIVAWNPDAPSGPWTATTPCPVCCEARRARERPGALRRLLGTPCRPGPASPPSVCSECGSAGSETMTFSEPDWSPERRAGRRVEEPVGPANETRADDVFGPPEDHLCCAVPDARELTWAKAPRQAQKPERAASGAWRVLRGVVGRLVPFRRPMLPPTYYEDRRSGSQERWNQAKELRWARDGSRSQSRSTSPLILPQRALEYIPEWDEPEDESRTQQARCR